MHKALQNLIELQNIDSQLQALESSRGDLPQKVSALKEEIAQIESRIADTETELEQHRARNNSVANEIAVGKERLKKYQNQLYQVKTNREYDAMTLEIDNSQSQVEQLEFESLELDERIEQLQSELGDLRESAEKLKETLDVQQEYLNKTLAGTRKREEQLEGERAGLLNTLPRPLLSTYERIRSARGGIALALLKNGACSECSSKIPPQRGMEIRMMNRLFLCEVCGRILIWRPDNPE